MNQNHSKLFAEICELYDMVSVSKCKPYARAVQSLSLDSGKGRLECRYIESYYPLKDYNIRVELGLFVTGINIPTETSLGGTITFLDFDENKIEHQEMLMQALKNLNRKLSQIERKPFYKNKLMSYASSEVFNYHEAGKDFINQQLSLVPFYRESIGNLLDLDFTKRYFFEIPVDEFTSEYKFYGRLLFRVQDFVEDSIKEKEFQKMKKEVNDSSRYQKKRSLEISMWKGFHLNEKEFQKLVEIINNHNFSIFVYTEDNILSNISINQLKELCGIG